MSVYASFRGNWRSGRSGFDSLHPPQLQRSSVYSYIPNKYLEEVEAKVRCEQYWLQVGS
jgi:hypothetical protein